MELYIRRGCQYCERVLAAAKRLGISLTLHDIADQAVAAELVARGGKQQVPYLVDAANGVEMYESEDIIDYLDPHREKAAGGRWTEALVNSLMDDFTSRS